jgi:cytochrome c553
VRYNPFISKRERRLFMRISLSMLFGVAIAAGLSAPTAALADGDAVAGAKVFKKCAACHVATEAKNRVGPHLVDIVDRPKNFDAEIEKTKSGRRRHALQDRASGIVLEKIRQGGRGRSVTPISTSRTPASRTC